MITSANLRSHYLRDVIYENKDSVWIAQKEGRTKNGDDRTQHSLLKMFRMSGPKDFVENFKELRVVPVSISYEWEPCDDLKTDELYQKTVGEYVKAPAADMRSMQQGLSLIHISSETERGFLPRPGRTGRSRRGNTSRGFRPSKFPLHPEHDNRLPFKRGGVT